MAPTQDRALIENRISQIKLFPIFLHNTDLSYHDSEHDLNHVFAMSHIKVYRDGSRASECYYWAPERAGQWAEIVYKYDFEKAIESADIFCQCHADNECDPEAQAIVEVSRDGKRWKQVPAKGCNSSVPADMSDSLKGSNIAFVRARLFENRSDGLPHCAHFMRTSDSSKAPRIYQFRCWFSDTSRKKPTP